MRLGRLAWVALAVTACGGGSSGGGGTPPPPAVASVTISPATAQQIAVGGTVAFSAQARDAQNNTLSNRTINWETTDGSKVSLSSTTGSAVTATAVAAGSSQIRARSEGIQSTQIMVTVTGGGGGGPNPSSASVTGTATNVFDPVTVTIAPGGTVTWTMVTRHNVTFTGSNSPTGGNTGDVTDATVSRTFPNAGSYPYTCTLHSGMNGTVNVQ